MLIPLKEYFMLLPNSNIAEVTPIPTISSEDTGPEHWLGQHQWQNQNITIIDVEALVTHRATDITKATKLCILNAVNIESEINYYAVPCFGSPQLITINETAIKFSDDLVDSDYIYGQIKIGNKVAFIPHLDNIELTLS
jgi:chemosensory pili system protein ChpC